MADNLSRVRTLTLCLDRQSILVVTPGKRRYMHNRVGIVLIKYDAGFGDEQSNNNSLTIEEVVTIGNIKQNDLTHYTFHAM